MRKSFQLITTVLFITFIVYEFNQQTVINSEIPQEKIDKYHLDILQKPYIINNKGICNDTEKVHVLILVHSAAEHFTSRAAIRSTYGSKTLFFPWQIRVVFLLGITQNARGKAAILKEEMTHRDIVQGNFVDTYHNLVHKALMGFKWATHFCQNVKYVLKTDDDIIFDMHRFLKEFPILPEHKTADVMCYVQNWAWIFRSGKWAIPSWQFKGSFFYPWSYCWGFTVVMKPQALQKLLDTAYTSPYFWIDDVFIYGMLRDRAKLTISSMPSGLGLTPYVTTECSEKTGRTCPYISQTVKSASGTLFKTIWKKWSQPV